MSSTAWPNQKTCQSNAQGQLTGEQQNAFGKPLSFGAYLGLAFILLLFPGFILAVYGAFFSPILIPTLAIQGNSASAQFLQCVLFFVILGIVFFIFAKLSSTASGFGSNGAMALFILWIIAALIITIILGVFARGFLLYYGAFILAIEGLMATSQIRVAKRVHIIKASSIISAEGEVRWNGNRYVGYSQGKQLRPLLPGKQLAPGDYRLYYYEKIPVLLSAEPLLSSSSSLQTINAHTALQEALFTALHFTPSDLLLHQVGIMAPAQQERWQDRIRKQTGRSYFSTLGGAFPISIGVLFLLVVLAQSIPPFLSFLTTLAQQPIAPFLLLLVLLVILSILLVVPVLFARRTLLATRAAAEAEHIRTWSGQVTRISSTYSTDKLYYPPQTRWAECRSADSIIGYLPERQARVIIPGNHYHIYTLASTKEIISAEIITEQSDTSIP